MKRVLAATIFLIGIVLASSMLAQAQGVIVIRRASTLPTVCDPAKVNSPVLVFKTSAPRGIYECTAVNTWTRLISGVGDVVGPSASTDSEMVLFSSTGGKTIKRSNTLSGLALMTSGVVTALTTSAELAAVISNETGSGLLVYNSAPTLVNAVLTNPTMTTPTLGVASATSVNKVTITAPATGSTITVAEGKTFTVSNTITFTATDGATVNVSNIPVTTNPLSQFAATTSAQLAGVLSNETGTDLAVFSTAPSLTNPRVITGINDTNGNELLKVTATASAVNEVTLANAATGNFPNFIATGDDTDIDVGITPKGAGKLRTPNGLLLSGGAGGNSIAFGANSVIFDSGADFNFVGVQVVGGMSAAFGHSQIRMGVGQLTFGTAYFVGNQNAGLIGAAAKVIGFTDASTNGGTFAAVATTPAQITGNQNDYNPGGSSYLQRWSSDASRNVTGLTFTAAQVSGQTHNICNIGAQNIVIVHEDAGSAAANRFKLTGATNRTIAADQCVQVSYDATTARWRAQ